MIRSSMGGQVLDFNNIGAFPFSALGVVAGTKDTIRGYAILGGCRGLLRGERLASTPNDERT